LARSLGLSPVSPRMAMVYHNISHPLSQQ
jgi:hypothetical protein